MGRADQKRKALNAGEKKEKKREIDCLVEDGLEVEKCRRYITDDGGV
jgi:hypothetical protein